ncbi:MAG: sensor histidine kinase [Vicinamibacterales bacterium]
MGVVSAAEVLNLVGFLTGAALFAMLLGLVRSGRSDAERNDALPLYTALLGLVWNLGELTDYVLSRVGLPGPEPWLNVVSFAALSLLAAVVVHSVARELRHGAAITAAAYGGSAVATAMHLWTLAAGGARPSSAAYGILAVALAVIGVPLALATRGQTNGRRVLWMLALALFAVSANHLGHFHSTAGGWLTELLGHHAALPLAFAILYQEYRFALADLFLKRALTLLAVVALAMGAYAAVTAVPPGPLAVALLLGAWVVTAIAYPALRRGITTFVDSALLGREDFGRLRSELAQALPGCESVEAVLQRTADVMARATSAERVSWDDPAAPTTAEPRVTAAIAVPTTEQPAFVLRIGPLSGGRRLLSDDRAFLDAAALAAARRIDAVRLSIERFAQRLRQEEMERLAAEAELRALRAQINPHFLFNTLTTIGYLIETAPARATKTLLRLTSLLRAVLRSDGELTTLGREIELVEHYLEIERERFEERLRVTIDVPAALRSLQVPCLLVQPLVENAVKHGIARAIRGGDVRVEARLDAAASAQTLVLAVRNTGAPLSAAPDGHSGGVGLSNVERRLAGHYGDAASLALSVAHGVTTAEIRLPATAAALPAADTRRAIG